MTGVFVCVKAKNLKLGYFCHCYPVKKNAFLKKNFAFFKEHKKSYTIKR